MRTFVLQRNEDLSGVSGTGIVAEGVQFHDGQIVLSWFGRLHTIVTAPNIETIERVHGHEGKTVIVWDEPNDPDLKRRLDIVDRRIRMNRKCIRLAKKYLARVEAVKA